MGLINHRNQNEGSRGLLVYLDENLDDVIVWENWLRVSCIS